MRKRKVIIQTAVISVWLLGNINDTYAQNTFPAAGNVVIGTTSPAFLLDVRGLSKFSQQIQGAAGLSVLGKDTVNRAPSYGIGSIPSMPFGTNIIQVSGYYGLYFRTDR